MSAIKNVLRQLALQFEDELAPLTTVHYNNADIRVDVGYDDPVKGITLDVFGPEDVEVFIPKNYYSFPVRFFSHESRVLSMSAPIDASNNLHNVYP